MKTYRQIVEFAQANPLTMIPSYLGLTPPEASPPHWNAYTGRSILVKAQNAVLSGLGDETFQAVTRTRKGTATTTTTNTIVADTLAPELRALLPAFGMKLGVTDVKTYIRENSLPATINTDPSLPVVVESMLEYFVGNNLTQSIRNQLLSWSGVPTREDVVRKAILEGLQQLVDDVRQLPLSDLLELMGKIKVFCGVKPDTSNTPEDTSKTPEDTSDVTTEVVADTSEVVADTSEVVSAKPVSKKATNRRV